MLLKKILVLGLFASTPAFATNFTVDFEKSWDYGADVGNYYNGGVIADGSTGPNLGVSFVGVSGLSNTAAFTYYTNAPSQQGVAYAYTNTDVTSSIMDVAAGVDNSLSFFYASYSDALGAIKAYSGLDGTGTLLGSIDLIATGSYDNWKAVSFNFNGTAQSFDLTGSANNVAFDNISAVPLPGASWLLGAGLALVGAISRRGKKAI